jgi:hypothetical protein
MTSEKALATAVRVLTATCAVLLVVAVGEGMTVRRARAELQELRDQRDQARAGITSAWARQSATEVGQALRELHNFYEEPTEGFGRNGGLCPNGRLDEQPIIEFAFGSFLQARAEGRSLDTALTAMWTAVRQSDPYRAVHPDLALPAKRPER